MQLNTTLTKWTKHKEDSRLSITCQGHRSRRIQLDTIQGKSRIKQHRMMWAVTWSLCLPTAKSPETRHECVPLPGENSGHGRQHCRHRHHWRVAKSLLDPWTGSLGSRLWKICWLVRMWQLLIIPPRYTFDRFACLHVSQKSTVSDSDRTVKIIISG